MTRHARATFPGSRLLVACLLATALMACSSPTWTSSPSSSSALSVAVTLTGVVRDTARRPVAGAVVTLEAQPGGGAVTNPAGAFTLSGTVPRGTPIWLRVTRDGYATASSAVAPGPIADVTLPNVGLTLVPAEPLVARRRTYAASITRHSNLTSFTIALGDATFVGRDIGLSGLTAMNFVSFDLYVPLDAIDGVALVEQLDDSFLSLMGSASGEATSTDRTIQATFAGTIDYCPDSPRIGSCAVTPITCVSTSHQAILSR